MSPENKRQADKKKPLFFRTDSHKKKKLGLKWRKPKGIQNKRRLMKRGYAPVVKKGYKSSNNTRGMTNKGLKPVYVTSKKELEKINKSVEGAIISGNLGDRKRLELLEEAKKLGVIIINLKTEEKIKTIKDSIEQRKKKKAKKEDVKKEKEEKAKKEEKKNIEESIKKEEQAKDEAKPGEEKEKKEKEKKEYDKLLTKKQQ